MFVWCFECIVGKLGWGVGMFFCCKKKEEYLWIRRWERRVELGMAGFVGIVLGRFILESVWAGIGDLEIDFFKFVYV